ncbi:MAG: TfoX/Sxy family DNA transformation protein, partial [Clostridia bacterium]|nr:TfoX/Sxy family DNA transformation protein [Clostridia bacterium]
MAELTTMTNIGKEMASKLKSVEIESAEKLIEIGSKEAFFRLKTKYPQVCLVHLYTLEGAIQNVEFNSLSKEKKAAIIAEYGRKPGDTGSPEVQIA